MQIFLARDNKQAGPYTLEQLNTMLTNGQVKLSDLAWHEGMENWLPLGNITGGQLYYTGTPATLSATSFSETQQATPAHHPSNTEIKTELTQPERAQTIVPATHAQRIAASMLDFMILFLCLLPIQLHIKLPEKMPAADASFQEKMAVFQKISESVPPEISMFSSIALFAFIVLQIILLARRGQTIGKAVLGVRIVDSITNQIPTFTRLILVRTFLVCVLVMVLGMLFIPIYIVFVFLSKDGRLLYDRLANTKIVTAKKPN